MRILIIHNQLWAHYKSRLFAGIYEELQRNYPDAAFRVVHIALYESARKTMQSDSSVEYAYPYEVLFRKSLDEVGLWSRVTALFREFRKFRPTVLNVTGYADWAQVALMFYARLSGVKVVLSSESSAKDHQRSGYKEQVKRWIAAAAHACFCFGKSSAQYLMSLGVPEAAIPVKNAAVIDDTLVAATYRKAREQYTGADYFIYTGRLAAEKNLLLLLEAYAALVDRTSTDWGLLIVGDGPQRQELEMWAERRCPGRVRFTGGVPWYEVPGWLARATVLVLPSKSEPWGLVVNEALVCGMPVIVSERCGCVEDLVENGKNGFVFNPEDRESLIAHMRYFTGLSPSELAAFSGKSRELVSRFAVEKVAAAMVLTYVTLSQRSKHP